MKRHLKKLTHAGVFLLLSMMPGLLWAQIPDWLWANASGNSSMDTPTATATDLNGNFYVCGGFRSPAINFGTGLLVNQGGSDLFLVKYTPDGVPVWATSIGGTGSE